MVRTGSDRPYLLIIHPGTLGDVVLSIEAIRSLRQGFPTHTFLLVSQSEVGRLLLECGEVDVVWALEGPFLGDLQAGFHPATPCVESVLRLCTHAVCWITDQNGCLAEGLKMAGVGEFLICSAKAGHLKSTHMSDRFSEVLQAWGVSPLQEHRPLSLSLSNGDGSSVSAQRVAVANRRETTTIVVHPGSGSPHKCCSAEWLGQVVRRLRSVSGRKILLCGGPADEIALRNLQGELYGVPCEVVCEKDLLSLAQRLVQVDLFLGHDSGLTHVAAALGVHTVALFGPTDPARWGPRGPHVSILQGPQCRCESWEKVQRCGSKICLDFSVDQVVQAIEQQLARAGSDSAESPHHHSQERVSSLALSK